MRDFQKLTDYCVKVFLAHGQTQCDAEEYAQDAIVRLLTAAVEIRNDRTYLYTVCMNILRHVSRGKRRFYKAASPVYNSQYKPRTPEQEAMLKEDPTEAILGLLAPGAAAAFRVHLDREGKSGKVAEGTNLTGIQRAAIWRAKEALRRHPYVKDRLELEGS